MISSPQQIPHRNTGFTLFELVAVVAILLILAAILFPVGKSMIRQGDTARDIGNLKSYATGLNLMANDLSIVTADDILHYSTRIDPYLGGNTAASKLLHSRQWARITRPVAKKQGKSISETTRSYTLNQTFFPSKPPPAASWEIDSITPAVLRSSANRPLLFSGVYLAGHNGAYAWGTRGHANPVYSDITKETTGHTVNGKTLVLFSGGSVRMVDFATENLPASGSGSDPEKWWVKP